MRFPIRAKLAVSVSLLILVVSILIVLVEQYQVRKANLVRTIELGESIADAIGSTCGYYVIFGLSEDLQAIATDLSRDRTIEYADFLSASGDVIAATDAKRLPEVFRQWDGSIRSRHSSVVAGEQTFQVFIRPFYENREQVAGAKAQGFFRLVLNDSAAKMAAKKLAMINSLVLVMALAVGAGLSVAGARVLMRPVAGIAESATKIASGDLTVRSESNTRDELGLLAETFNQMTANLRKTIEQIKSSQAKVSSVVETVGPRSRSVLDSIDRQGRSLDSAYSSIDELNSGIRKITDNVESLSASSEETSSSILEMVASLEEVSRHTDSLYASVEDTSSATEEMVTSISEVGRSMDYLQNFVTDTSTSMVEMSTSISQVESNAARSHDLAQAVAEAAGSGMRAVSETIEGMEEIRRAVLDANEVVSRLGEKSVSIGKILNVIDDIAEQTNLLALNAAILAAQAGEQGKGFSVVAAEIRDLSERTASSTREIDNLIRAVQMEVENALKTMARGSSLVEGGVELSHEAGRALNHILESARKSSDMVKEIANATREQAQGSEAVAHAIEKLQEMVRQINTATSQQATGSDHILRAVETMREITRYVRQATTEQKSGSVMISKATEQMIDKVHEIFEVAASQSAGSERILETVEQVREIAELNRRSVVEMNESIHGLGEAMRALDEEVRKFRVRA